MYTQASKINFRDHLQQYALIHILQRPYKSLGECFLASTKATFTTLRHPGGGIEKFRASLYHVYKRLESKSVSTLLIPFSRGCPGPRQPKGRVEHRQAGEIALLAYRHALHCDGF